MSRRISLTLILFVCLVSASLAVFWIGQKRQGLANLSLTFAILIISVLIFYASLPTPAKIEVTHLDELETDDLIFYSYPAMDLLKIPLLPLDYLLQLHVAVSNVGNKKAILSAIRLEGFRNDLGETIHLPGAKSTIDGVRWQQKSGWVNGNWHFENLNIPMPHVLDPDEAVVVRFRTRRGVAWGDAWGPTRLKEFVAPLQAPIVGAHGTVIWRRANKVVQQDFSVPMNVKNQEEYVRLISELSNGFTSGPVIPEQTINIE